MPLVKRLSNILHHTALLTVLLFFTVGTTSVSSQPNFSTRVTSTDNFRGIPFIQNFNPKEYLHLTSSFEHTSIIQDNQGRMLIGSHGGILVYNGNNWQLVETPGRSIVWSMDKDAKGRIYVGATNNLGYLAADKNGKTHFISLLSHLPKNMPPLGEVWTSIVTPEGIYFKSNQFLMRWQNNQFRVWKAQTAFGATNWINGILYVHQPDKGLFVMRQDSLEAFSTNNFFVQNAVRFIQPIKPDKWLMGTYSNNLVYFNGQTIIPVNQPLQSFLQKNGVFQCQLLPDANIALTTLKGGVIIINQKDNIQAVLNKESGLAANTTYSLGLDNSGGLWISLEKGLSRVQLGSAFSYFNERNGLLRQTYALVEHQGTLLAGTTDGLFMLKEKTLFSPSAQFQKIPGFNSTAWSFQPFGESLLISSDGGLFEWRDKKITAIPIASTPWENYSQDIQRSNLDSAVVFVASKGLSVFRRVNQQWKNLGKLPGLQENLSQIIQSPTGDLWLPVQSGIARVQFPNKDLQNGTGNFLQNAVIKHYGTSEGIPPGTIKLFLVGQELIAQVGEANFRLFRFRENLNKFESMPDFGKQFGLTEELLQLAKEYNDVQNVWLWAKKKNNPSWKLKLAQQQNGKAYSVQTFDLSGLTAPLKSFAYEQTNGVLWFTGIDGLVRFNLPAHREVTPPFPTLLERIILPSDSVIYPQAGISVRLPFTDNSLRFEVAAPSYNGTDENRFQFWLQEYETSWTPFTKEPFKEYTRIPEGTYTFHVRGINAQGIVGKEAQYTFTILPPWYRTTLMKLFYLLCAGGAVFGFIRWRSSKLKAEKAYLEQVVALRTKEVADKNNQLSQQTEVLAAQTEKLKELDQVKSRFFANISHEFRTPITIILNNLLDKLAIKETTSEQTQVPVRVTDLKVMSRNARRLLQLINQLLDLSKIESGNMSLDWQDGDLKQLCSLVFASFYSLAEHQHIHFSLELPEEPLLCQYDPDKIEKVLYNLLSNAFKFTPAHGEVQLKAELIPVEQNPNAAIVQITVQDTGPGLTPEELDKVFNRFYQGKQFYADAQGTGIGLALAKELVELHQGQIRVESAPSKGATFVVELPFVPVSAASLPITEHPASKSKFEIDIIDPQPKEITPFVQENNFAASSESEGIPLVLLVEDNKDLRDYLRQTLEDKYRILESINGVEGLAKAQNAIPDLIISDWMMPQMDGIELCGHLKADVRTSHIPVILLTALATTDAKLTGLETGADDYLTKPFDSKELHVRINNLIENRRKMREHFSREIRLEPTKMVVASVDEKFLQKAMQIVEERMEDAEFSVDEFSREIGLSRVHLHRKLKALTGQAPSDFIRVIRLKQAAHLLESRAGNIAEIAYQVGFNNLSYFSKCFREQYGILPNEYTSRQPTPSS